MNHLVTHARGESWKNVHGESHPPRYWLVGIDCTYAAEEVCRCLIWALISGVWWWWWWSRHRPANKGLRSIHILDLIPSSMSQGHHNALIHHFKACLQKEEYARVVTRWWCIIKLSISHPSYPSKASHACVKEWWLLVIWCTKICEIWRKIEPYIIHHLAVHFLGSCTC